MKPIRTIGQYLPSLKDPVNIDEITCVVKEVLCKDCDFVYVGQTKRDLNSRLKEHQRAIKQQKPENSALCEHVILFDHVIDWANSRILKTESNFSKRLTAECWFIRSRPKVINRSDVVFVSKVLTLSASLQICFYCCDIIINVRILKTLKILRFILMLRSFSRSSLSLLVFR